MPKRTFLTYNVSSIISNHFPVKYKDPGYPTISIVTDDQLIQRALLDLGVVVNLLLFTVYEKLD